MKIAMLVPGGVDRSGEVRVIPALLALIERVARAHELHVFALHQERAAGCWELRGARIHNAGAGFNVARAHVQLLREHRRAPFDLLQSIFSGTCGLVAVSAARWLRRPVCVHLAGGELAALPDIGYGGSLHWHARLMNGWVLRHADLLTAASRPMLASLAALGLRGARIPLGVDLGTWPPLAPRRRNPGEPARLIHVASLNRVKDQGTLLAAMASLAATRADFHLDIVGEDTLGGRVQDQAARAGLGGRVTFHGFKTQRELRPLVEAAHLNIVSSRHEAGPLVALEAAVAGVPTVGTAVGHVSEWAPGAALAVPVRDPVALAAAIARVLDDEALRLALAGAAARIAIEEDADYCAAQFLDRYRQLSHL